MVSKVELKGVTTTQVRRKWLNAFICHVLEPSHRFKRNLGTGNQFWDSWNIQIRLFRHSWRYWFGTLSAQVQLWTRRANWHPSFWRLYIIVIQPLTTKTRKMGFKNLKRNGKSKLTYSKIPASVFHERVEALSTKYVGGIWGDNWRNFRSKVFVSLESAKHLYIK